MPYLEIKLGPDTLLLRFVGRIDYVFGRLPRADVQLRDMKVSRLHTQCFIDSRGNAFVRDLGSSGGTFINNQRLRRGVIAPLTNGLKFRIGDAKLTYYDSEPPVNAVDPPSQSMPRGLIRTNHRERFFEAEATVLAMNKVDPETQSGPAEPPPELNPNDFADGPADVEAKPQAPAAAPAAQKAPAAPPAVPAAKAPTRRPSGIVEAPWEKPAPAAAKEKRVTIPPPTRGGAKQPAQPPMETAEIDEMGQFHAPPAAPRPASGPAQQRPAPPRSPLPPRQPVPAGDIDPTGRTSREPVVADSAAFRPPPPISGEMPVEEEEPPQRVGLPTVRLERPAIIERQKQIEEEEAAEAAALRIPTASVKPVDIPAPVDEAEPPPQIGVANPNREVLQEHVEDEIGDETIQAINSGIGADIGAGEEVASEAGEEEDLTDDQITEYLGGSVSGRFGDIDFGDKPAAEPAEADEVRFGSAVQAGLQGDADIDLEDEPPGEQPQAAEEEPEIKEVSTSMLGNTTAVKEEPVEEVVEEAVKQAAEPAESTSVDEPEETTGAAVDVPTYADHQTPPPGREGATEDRTFKPRKTRKLMKRRKDTAKITDRSNPTPLPEGAKTVHIPLPAEQPVVPGAKTMFIPKPEDAKISAAPSQPERPTGKPRSVPENRERKTLQDMSEGPGGDTVAMPPAMMKQLQEELKKQYSKPKSEEPPTIGDNPTVKLSDSEDEDEFVLDDDYAFFTPPPATRKAREAAQRAMQADQGDVINANDFGAETSNLPPDKKAASKEDPDTLVD